MIHLFTDCTIVMSQEKVYEQMWRQAFGERSIASRPGSFTTVTVAVMKSEIVLDGP